MKPKTKDQRPKQIFQTKAKVVKNLAASSDYYKMVLEAPRIAASAVPGQFINIRVSDKYEPLLRRPLSIHRVISDKSEVVSQIEILYKIVGRGTEILSQKRCAEYLDVIGPLGSGFNYQLPITNYQLPILVAGGMGVAPLVFLAEKLVHSPEPTDHRKVLVLLGAKNKKQVVCKDELKKLGCDVKIATDDGSLGFKGFVTELLRKKLSTMDYGLWTIFACGPKPMLKEIAIISKQYDIPAQISLEEQMACGIGACFGCVVQLKKGYKRACKDGPVFNAKEIIF